MQGLGFEPRSPPKDIEMHIIFVEQHTTNNIIINIFHLLDSFTFAPKKKDSYSHIFQKKTLIHIYFKKKDSYSHIHIYYVKF